MSLNNQIITENEMTPSQAVLEVKARKEAEEKNKNIAKGGIDAFNEYMNSTLNAIPNGVTSVTSGLANVGTTLIGAGLKTINKIAKNDKIDEMYDKVIEAGRYIDDKGNYNGKVNSMVENNFTRNSANVVNTVSQMLTAAGLGSVTGVGGMAINGLYVGGKSAQEVLNENKDKIYRASITGLGKGYASYLTGKMFDSNILTRGMNQSSIQETVNKLITTKINSQIGQKVASKAVGIVGENIEEFIEDNVDNVIDKLVNNKKMPGFKEWLNNTTETAKLTTITTIAMNLLGLGGTNIEDVKKDAQAQKWINEAQKIIDSENLAIIYDNNQINTQQNSPVPPVNTQQESNAVAPINVQNLLNNEISTAVQNKTSKGKVTLGRVTENVVNSVKSLLGIDVTNRTHVLTDNDIRHMLNEHGDPKVESKRGQIAITENDIQKIPDIINNYDDIVKGNPNRNGDTIRYIKNFEDGTTYLVEVVPETSKTLNIKTMWKKPTSLANHLEPSLTSETQSRSISSTSNNIISQNQANMQDNKQIPPINNIQEETNNVVPFRTEEQIANDKSISDLEALREAAQQVGTPTLPRVQQLENELQENNIDRSPTIEYIKRKRSKEKPTIKEIKDTLAQRFVNKGHYIDKLASQTGNKRLTHLYDRTMNTFNEAQISIGDYQVNSKGDIVGDSLIDIFQPSVDSGLELEFEDYLLNKHNVARYAHEKGLYGNEITASDSADTVLKYENMYPEFKKWAEEVYKYNDNNLKDLVANGIVSKELYDKTKSMYGSYVPTYRDIVDNISQYEDNAVGSNPLKRATQSNKDILSVKESMAEQTLMQKKAIRMNNLGLELYKTLGKDSTILEGIEIDPIAMQTIGGDVVEKATDGTNIFTVFDNGEMKQFKISDELYSAFSKDNIQNKINNNKVAKALLTPVEKMSKAQRELLTTYSIGFALNNPIIDFQDALFYTKYGGATFLKNYTKALYNIGTGGSWYQSYKNNGGTANTYFDYNKGILPVKTKNPVKKFAKAIRTVNEVLEQAPRLAEYISTIENGGDIDEALYNAADITTNFKRGGDITKALNKYGANFLNASIQGLDKVYRNITGRNGIRGYANLLTKAVLYQIAPAVLNGLLLKDDEDYEDLPEYTKDNYFLFKMGDGKFFRIPKGRLSAVVGGIARRALETVEGKDVDWKSIIDTTTNQLAPNNPLTDNVVAPIAQAVKNKSWYGGDIVNSRLQKLPTSEQYDESTDKISKWLGEKLNISPKKINYVLDQYSGGIGDVVLPMLTPQAENNILEDKFTTDAIMKNKNVSEYYSQLSELEKNSNSINATDKDKLKYKYITNTSSNMSDLYKQKREIQNSNLSDKVKKERVRKIQKQINELAEGTLKALDEDITIKNNVADVSGTQYYKYNDKWTMLSDEDNEKTQNISLSTFADYKNKLYKLTQETEKKGSTVKDSDKIKILLNSKYSNKEKQELYKNYIGTTDKKYSIIEDLGIDINEYLKYKSRTFEGQKNSNGKTISGSVKSQVKDYINTLKLSPIQKTILFNSIYKDTSYNEEIYNYINNLKLSATRKKEIWESLGYK